MAIDLTEWTNDNSSKWQVVEADIGGSIVLHEYDERAEAVQTLINLKQQNPGRWLAVTQVAQVTTWIYCTV